jgi:hypothetical protein
MSAGSTVTPASSRGDTTQGGETESTADRPYEDRHQCHVAFFGGEAPDSFDMRYPEGHT